MKIIFFLFAFFSFCTYITQYYFGFGEFYAEGIPLIIGFYIYAYFVRKTIIKINLLITFTLLYLFYLIIITLIYIFIDNINPFRLIFIYQYILGFIFIVSLNTTNIDYKYYSKIIVFFAFLSSLIGIIQFFNINEFIPIDNSRARGTSRSTLNYSSLLFIGFSLSIIFLSGYKKFFSFIIFLGILVSGGRGAIYSSILFYFLISYNKIYLLFFILFFLFIYYLNSEFFLNENINNLFFRIYNGLSTKSDPANVDRIEIYSKFFDNFHIFGLGVGSTGPAAQRFSEGTGYESFLLALLTHGGVISFIYLLSIFFILLNKWQNYSILLKFFISMMIMMTFQQTFETPTVNIIVWFSLFFIHSYCRELNNDSKSINSSFIKRI